MLVQKVETVSMQGQRARCQKLSKTLILNYLPAQRTRHDLSLQMRILGVLWQPQLPDKRTSHRDLACGSGGLCENDRDCESYYSPSRML